MNRRTAAVLILACWGLTIGWLIRREYFPVEAIPDSAAEWAVPPGAAFFSIRSDRNQVGLASVTVDTVPEGIRVVELYSLDLPQAAGQTMRRTSLRTESLYSRNLRLRRWRTDYVGDGGRTSTSGSIESDTAALIVTGTPEQAETLRTSLTGPVVLPGAVPFRLRLVRGDRVGRTFEVSVLDPVTLDPTSERVSISAESLLVVADSAVFDSVLSRWVPAHYDTVQAWRLEATEHGVPVVRWVDEQGLVVMRRARYGLVQERGAFELVSTNFRRRPVAMWDTASTMISLTAPTPITESDSAALALAADVPPDSFAPEDSMAMQAALAATPLISAGDPQVRALAAGILGPTSGAAPSMARLGQWVRDSVRPLPGPALASAPRTLTRRAGTSADRITLLIALARASGIPARRAAGLRSARGRLVPHGWVEYYDAGWHAMDLEYPNAGRVRLTLGSPARLLDLLPLAARAQVTRQEMGE